MDGNEKDQEEDLEGHNRVQLFNYHTFFLTSNYLTLRFTMSEQNKLEVHGAGMVIVKVHSGS